MSAVIQMVPCPLCGERAKFLDVRAPYRDEHIASYGDLYAGRSESVWKICGRCGFVHQNPRPSTAALDAFYATAKYRPTHDAPDVQQYATFAEWYFGTKADYVARVSGLAAGTVFEVGCGFGGALLAFRSRGWNCKGIEPDEHCAAYAREQLGLKGVVAGLLGPDIQVDERADVVFSNHAFEHFANLDGVMRGICRVLKPGGLLITVVPTYRDNRSTMSKRWMNSGHYSLFSHQSLNHLVSKFGFEPAAYTYRGWLTEIDELWHCARLNGGAKDSERFFEDSAHVAAYLKWINPARTALYYPIFDRWNKKRDVMNLMVAAARSFVRSPGDFHRRAYRKLQEIWSR